jgi:hypothetical protein
MVDLLKPSPILQTIPQLGLLGLPAGHCPIVLDANGVVTLALFQRQRIGWHLLEIGEVRMVKETTICW